MKKSLLFLIILSAWALVLHNCNLNNDTLSTTATYTITYDGNGATSGSVPVDSTQYAPGATVTVLDNTGNLAKSGYTFSGWNTAADGSGQSYSPGATFTINTNTVLYAQWAAPGSLDSSFDPGTGPDGYIYSIALQSDGKILIGGDFTSYNGTGRNYIARIFN